MNEPWRIELFGGLRARQGDRVLMRFETRKAGALLACLALSPHWSRTREQLVEELWPGEDPEVTRTRLRQALAALRRALEPRGAPIGSVIVADRSDVRLDPRLVTTDVADFEEALRSAARSALPEQQVHALVRAVELHGGELLPGYYEPEILAARERLAEEYLVTLHQLVEHFGTKGDHDRALEYARRAVNSDPMHEEARRDLMRLLAAVGRTSEAMRHYTELERLLQDELGVAPSSATRKLAEQIRSGVQVLRCSGVQADERPIQPPTRNTQHFPPEHLNTRTPEHLTLEPVGGAVPLDSPFYVARVTDEEFEAAIARRDSIVLVKGPRQVGKTSLLARGLRLAREAGAKVVLTDFQRFTQDQLASTDRLFLTIAESMAEQMELDVAPDAVWASRRGWNVNFERFLRREVLGDRNVPVIWALDEVDRLFPFSFAAEVFGLFRSWHNERSLNPAAPWGQLTLAIAYATEAHLFITDLNQSPFNVGTRLALDDFTREQVTELNRRYRSPLRDDLEVARYFAVVGGHPYLVRRGLHEMSAHGMDIDGLEPQAEREDGPFGDHLRRMLVALAQDAQLCSALRGVLKGEPCPDTESFYRLRSAGILVGDSPREVRPRCGLYRRYLERHLV